MYFSSGNNFYLDNVKVTSWPVGVGNVSLKDAAIAVVPNPTSGDAYVVLKDADNTVAHIIVTDITGKVVYTTSQQVTGNEAYIQIPHSAISVKGMYSAGNNRYKNTYTETSSLLIPESTYFKKAAPQQAAFFLYVKS